jgi:hypothetical protein
MLGSNLGRGTTAILTFEERCLQARFREVIYGVTFQKNVTAMGTTNPNDLLMFFAVLINPYRQILVQYTE